MERLTEAMAILDQRLLEQGWTLMPAVARVCPACEGWGFVRSENAESVCPRCYGDGEDHSAQTIREQLRDAGLEAAEGT